MARLADRGLGSGRALLYELPTGTTTDLGTLPGYERSEVFGINDAGPVAGFARVTTPGGPLEPIRPFLSDHRDGTMTDLNDLIPAASGWVVTYALDINNAGEIVGQGMLGGERHVLLLTPVG
ncbi:MAG: hypothetical protein AVDCRST_MAG19-4153 [uncultured Thermomicrobiales bacterium]|uniref:Uncharacterized protein n=1 Tax=uncultured Thermomicrobiales bacterium TaxID=1645740 RepID=A0A6J4VQH0_9BACT|nr:MAG: hypothetical protein AVDCRST_MAG19-4153 [uncultured Thermomicrobiales bacterium]